VGIIFSSALQTTAMAQSPAMGARSAEPARRARPGTWRAIGRSALRLALALAILRIVLGLTPPGMTQPAVASGAAAGTLVVADALTA
jgi:hypothetical protein